MSSQPTSWANVSVSEVCEFKYGKSLPSARRSGGPVAVFGSNGIVGHHDEALTSGPTIVIGRKGSLGEINYSEYPCWPIDTTYYVDATCTDADLRWLSHRLASLGLTRLNRAAAIPGLNRDDAYQLRILLPPFLGQRRLARILDQAEVLRATRRKALAELNELTQSIFLDMLGDPVVNPRGWPLVKLAEVLLMPLRNGISPSEGGQVPFKVLTLSAITGGKFEATALKFGRFKTVASPTKTVDDSDLLICRGNGNIKLVGRAYFPTSKMADTLFPDTIIAARVSTSRVCPTFLEIVWDSGAVRRQIETVARTTNGTFKINQKSLEEISFYLPPLSLQQEFDERMKVVGRMKESYRAHLAELDALFTSLQYRAFRGEL
ncbi:MAG: restriction endonuclease subunit S [Pseudonocardiaceae bacterium]